MNTWLIILQNDAQYTTSSITNTAGTALTTMDAIGGALENFGSIVFTDLNSGVEYTLNGSQVMLVRSASVEAAQYENGTWQILL